MLDFEIRKMLEVTEEGDQTFFKIDSIPERYLINHKGLIFDNLHKKDIYPSFLDGYLRVNINIDGTFVKFDLRKLWLMAFSPMHTTCDVYMNKLKAISFDGNLCNISKENLIWKVPAGGVQCLKYIGFYSIPSNPNIVISRKGEVLDYRSGFFNKINMPKVSNRYPETTNSIAVYGPFLGYHTHALHRLMALAFIPLEGARDRFYVNHIDGNKLNYDVKNLEWVTYKENREHAVKAGLCVQSVRLMAIDIYTGQRRSFASLQTASRALGLHAYDISKAIKAYKGQGKVICPPWLFLEEGDSIPTSFIRIQKRVVPIGVRWFTVEKDGNLKYVSFVGNLIKEVGNKEVVIEKTKEYYNTFEVNGYTVKEVYRQDVPVDVYKRENEWRGGKEQKAIRVTDLTSGAVITYPSTDHFATLVGAKRKTIQRRMLYNDGVWRDFKIEYIDKQ